MTSDEKVEAVLHTFETQVGEATQFWFAAAAMNEVARLNTDTLNALNLTPSFWVTARVAMEYQAILTTGKIFGPRKTNPNNIDSLFQVLRENRVAVFSKDALAARKRRMSDNADEWLRDYVKGVHVPTARDLNRLHELSKRHRKTYETQYADVRNLHVAHSAIADANARSVMFQKTRIRDFERLIVRRAERLHHGPIRLLESGAVPRGQRELRLKSEAAISGPVQLEFGGVGKEAPKGRGGGPRLLPQLVIHDNGNHISSTHKPRTRRAACRVQRRADDGPLWEITTRPEARTRLSRPRTERQPHRPPRGRGRRR